MLSTTLFPRTVLPNDGRCPISCIASNIKKLVSHTLVYIPQKSLNIHSFFVNDKLLNKHVYILYYLAVTGGAVTRDWFFYFS